MYFFCVRKICKHSRRLCIPTNKCRAILCYAPFHWFFKKKINCQSLFYFLIRYGKIWRNSLKGPNLLHLKKITSCPDRKHENKIQKIWCKRYGIVTHGHLLFAKLAFSVFRQWLGGPGFFCLKLGHTLSFSITVKCHIIQNEIVPSV